MEKRNWTIGVDEVGRGPLAGPVTVGAILVKSNLRNHISKFRKPLRDSKKLTQKQREEWFRWIEKEKKRGRICCAFASVLPKTIDRINVTAAANRAAARAIKKVLDTSGVHPKRTRIFLDGGLYPTPPTPHCKLHTVVGGDEMIPAVSLASIAAKVTRDRYMVRLAKQFPEYGFERHKGYGTAAHWQAIKKHGVSPHHRLTFLKKYTTLA